MKRALFLVGHTQKAKGAMAYNGMLEWDFNYSVLAELLLIYNSDSAKRFEAAFITKDSWRSFSEQISQSKQHFDVSVEMHFNSFSKEAHGCECLALTGNAAAGRFAAHMASVFHAKYGMALRHDTGVLYTKQGDRGNENLRIVGGFCDAPIIVEPCFANADTLESRAIIEQPKIYAETLYHAVGDYLS